MKIFVADRPTHFLLFLTLVSLLVTTGCGSEPSDISRQEMSSQTEESESSKTVPNSIQEKGTVKSESGTSRTLSERLEKKSQACSSIQAAESRPQLRRYVWLHEGEYKKVAATSDTVGLVLTSLFSPPGQWSTESTDSDWADGILRYHCYIGIRSYTNCGQPESIGNPKSYDGSEDLFIYFKYRIEPDDCTAKFIFHKDHQASMAIHETYLRHHGFPVSDTVVLPLEKLYIK